MNLVNVGAQNAAIQIRKHVEAPPSGAIIRATASAFLLMPADMVEAHRKLLDTMDKCWSKCIANLEDPDTTTADADKAYTALRHAEKAAVESSDNLRGWVAANLPELEQGHEAFKVEAADEALALLARLGEVADEVAARSQALSRCRDNRKSAQWSPLGHIRRIGGESIHNATVAFEALLPKAAPTRVSNAAMKALQRGEDATDIDGNVLTHEEADALHRQGLLKVAHSPGGLLGGIPS